MGPYTTSYMQKWDDHPHIGTLQWRRCVRTLHLRPKKKDFVNNYTFLVFCHHWAPRTPKLAVHNMIRHRRYLRIYFAAPRRSGRRPERTRRAHNEHTKMPWEFRKGLQASRARKLAVHNTICGQRQRRIYQARPSRPRARPEAPGLPRSAPLKTKF